MANAVINQDTGYSLEYHRRIQDETTPYGTKQQQTSLEA
jgi:hypothetical protein